MSASQRHGERLLDRQRRHESGYFNSKGFQIADDVDIVRGCEISVPIAAGGSGGAVFDVFGRVVGIATTPHPYGANLNIAIPSSLIETMRTRERAAAK